jgi:hydroxymethylglutaryl-CoA reductase (NADPH)
MTSGNNINRVLSRPPQGGDLLPRMSKQGYASGEVENRRRWVAERTGAAFKHVAACSIPTESLRGNVENLIGSAQVPLGVAGPLQINGEFADGVYYVPLATTEGALVRSYERGMLVVSRSGGATARVIVDENCIAPIFCFEGLVDACAFARTLPDRFEEVRRVAESTTRHGRLLRLEPRVLGRDVSVRFCYHTADAHGMNMIQGLRARLSFKPKPLTGPDPIDGREFKSRRPVSPKANRAREGRKETETIRPSFTAWLGQADT